MALPTSFKIEIFEALVQKFDIEKEENLRSFMGFICLMLHTGKLDDWIWANHEDFSAASVAALDLLKGDFGVKAFITNATIEDALSDIHLEIISNPDVPMEEKDSFVRTVIKDMPVDKDFKKTLVREMKSKGWVR